MILSPGCYIDGSHWSPYEFDKDVLRFAENLGWDGGVNILDVLYSDWEHYIRGTKPEGYEGDEDSFAEDYREALDYAAEDAVEWLNDNKFGPDNVYWTIDDNSLYLWEDEDEDL